MLAPTCNTSLTRYDAIIVLGNPADRDGNPKPELLARVTEGVHEYERGVAPRLILTGAAVRNGFIEARVMAISIVSVVVTTLPSTTRTRCACPIFLPLRRTAA